MGTNARRDSREQTARAAVHRPSVELAESIARFEKPFQYLKTVRGGFDPARRFLLDRTLKRDRDALAARDDVMKMERQMRLGEPLGGERDLELEFYAAHEEELLEYQQASCPWMVPPWDPGAKSDADPAVDELLDHYICDGLKDYGFDRSHRKARKNYWRCESPILSHRMFIHFDKGTRLPSRVMNGSLELDGLPYKVPLGDPFFFSGSVFYTSRADDPAAQMKLFFDEYHRIFPHVIDALSRGIAAALDK